MHGKCALDGGTSLLVAVSGDDYRLDRKWEDHVREVIIAAGASEACPDEHLPERESVLA